MTEPDSKLPEMNPAPDELQTPRAPSFPLLSPERVGDHESKSESIDQEPATQPEPSRPARSPRLRLFFFLGAILGILPLVAAVGLYFFISSATFESFIRKQLIASLESATGGRVEIASFHWHPFQLEADADGVVIHGLEDPGEAPYAQADALRVRLSLMILWSPRILLRDL